MSPHTSRAGQHWDALGITYWERWGGGSPAETPCSPEPPPAALSRAGAAAPHGHRGHGLVLVPVPSRCDSIWLHLLPPGLGGPECGSWRARVTQRGAAGQQLIPPGCAGCAAGRDYPAAAELARGPSPPKGSLPGDYG